MPRLARLFALGLLLSWPGFVVQAHQGGLDGNGCHYETASARYHCHRDPRRNRDTDAPAKKSRKNICHDRSSPNYTTLKYFVSYPSLQACLASGGRAVGS
jgi:hypothetical protein